jgi:hypothetical protein
VSEAGLAAAAKLEELSETIDRLSDELVIAVDEEHKVSKELSSRLQWEDTCQLLLGFLNSLPEKDKEGKLMTLKSYRAHARMQRKTKAQLTINRIAVRGAMVRFEESNDWFCGKKELLCFVGLLRGMTWVKSFMKW